MKARGQRAERAQPAPEAPQSELRDLRPEKDPIGAGGKRSPDTGSTRFLR